MNKRFTYLLSVLLAQQVIGQDLIPQSFKVHADPLVKGINHYQVTHVKNAGTVRSGNFKVGYYLSADAVYNLEDRFIGNSDDLNLAAGLSDSTFVNVSIPNDAAPGNYYLLARTDYENTVAETNELNNTISTAITVVEKSMDLSISGLTYP